jgi:amino acid permease
MYTLCKPVFDRFFVSYVSLEENVELKIKSSEEDGIQNEFQKETSGLLSKKSEAKIHIPEKIFYGMSVLINLVTLVVAIMVPDISDLLKIVGATMGATMAFIIPALIALKHKPSNDSQLKHTLTQRHRLQARILLAIGTLVFVITPISMIYE